MRRKFKVPWLLIPVVVTLMISGSFIINRKEVSVFYIKTTPQTTQASFSLAPLKHVTKSLSELGKMDLINSHVLFLNHVPNSGAEILILLLQRLQGFNNYRHVRLKDGNRRKLSRLQQEQLVYEIYDVMRNEAVPLSFDRHVYFINFSSFDKQSPTFINLIRNPVDKVISRASFNNKYGRKDYFRKCLLDPNRNCNFKDGKPYDLTIPYFCGHDPRCLLLNNDWALQEAKSNVEKYYPVVGILEELNSTLEVMENKLPYFFKNVQKTYQKYLLNTYNKSKNRTKIKDPKLESILKKSLVKEYEFYEWAKQRLFHQLQIIYGEHGPH